MGKTRSVGDMRQKSLLSQKLDAGFLVLLVFPLLTGVNLSASPKMEGAGNSFAALTCILCDSFYQLVQGKGVAGL